MANNSVTVSQLPITTTLNANDRIVVLSSVSSTAVVSTIALSDFIINENNKLAAVPAAANSSGNTGTIAFSNAFLYVCISSNTWVRTPLSIW